MKKNHDSLSGESVKELASRIRKEYIVFVHEELPIFLKTTDIKKSFSYTEWKIGNLTMREDDTPCWIVEYYDHSFIVLRDPINKLTTK